MRAFTDSFNVSNPGQNYTVSELHDSRIPCKSSCHNFIGEFFRLLGRNVNADWKDRNCFKIVRKSNGLSFLKENASECTAQNNSIFAFAFDNIRFLHSGIYEWILQALWTSKSSCSYQEHCYLISNFDKQDKMQLLAKFKNSVHGVQSHLKFSKS